LQEERVQNHDVFVACTQSHETNILAAALAKQAGCRDVIALVSDESFAPLMERLGISYPLSERASISRRVHAILHADAVISVSSLYNNQAKIMEVKISPQSEIVGAPISAVSASFPADFLIALVENRNGVTIPKGSNVLTPGDTAIVICSPESVAAVERIL
jgi:trk system potassium uptake protein TrkA